MLRSAATALALAGMAAAASLPLALPDGGSVDVEAFANGVLRLRVRPTNAASFYDPSTEVVVAKPADLAAGAVSGDAAKVSVTHGESSLTVAVNGDKVDFQFVGGSDGVAVTTGSVGRNGDRPTTNFVFPHATKLYGIPEHAVDLALKSGTTYRLMNLDVFQYKLDDPGGIYGTIPFLMAHAAGAAGRTTAVLVLNAADSNVAVNAANAVEWSSETGAHDIFFFPGPTPVKVHQQHAAVVGPTMLPPQFALGYHQCRWNYRSVADTLEVNEGFNTHNIPADVIWLDIEHTDGKRYFTWDPHNFKDPKPMIDRIAADGRKTVTITDPHIKRDPNYHVHAEATAKGFYVKNSNGDADYEGHCWPGTSSWVDFINSDARSWYATMFRYDRYTHSTPNLYTWIDMNEPSVFNSPEVTMDKNAVHRNAAGQTFRHRDVHNVYGYLHTMAAHEGHMLRSTDKTHHPDGQTRPFILTRSFFSGSQRYAAMWTGDNMADWGHLRKSIPMLLTLSLANYVFVGADVGGFFNNPSVELLTRWYQAGAFYPFFRGHAHLETKRREPWLFGDEATNRIRDAIATRYALMPYSYTQFFLAHDGGAPVMRPLFYEWPQHEAFLEEQAAFLVGPALLVRPVLDEGAASVTVPLPGGDEAFFAFPSGEAVPAGATSHTVYVTMDSIPAFLRAGHVLPVRQRMRRSTAGMQRDPYTLYVAVNGRGNSAGQLYEDDAQSFKYKEGGHVLRSFAFSDGKLTNRAAAPSAVPAAAAGVYQSPNTVERIVFWGLNAAPSKVVAQRAGAAAVELEFTVGENNAVVVRKPDLPIGADWTIELVA